MKLSLPLLLIVFVARSLATVAVTTTTVPNGIVKTAYTAVITASGGCTPYKWEIVSGNLPAGLTEKTSTSTTSIEVSGDPTTAASYSFTVSVTGCGGHVSTASYQIVIQAEADHVVDLTWDASTSSDIVGYNVYRAPDGVTWEKLNTSLIAAKSYSDSAVADNSTYYYAATAVNADGEESQKTAELKVAVP
jgi:hypothetical protein